MFLKIFSETPFYSLPKNICSSSPFACGSGCRRTFVPSIESREAERRLKKRTQFSSPPPFADRDSRSETRLKMRAKPSSLRLGCRLNKILIY
ncbi:MAG: hypothetical protein Q7S82_00115 [bacterium]|nr:hypothetical protein [bacterium]